MLKELVANNRSCRGFDPIRAVTEEELKGFADLARVCPCGSNQQALRFRPVFRPEEARAVQKLTRWGAALPELHLPFAGQEAPAFIVICADPAAVKSRAALGIDTGIAAQTMALAATEAGLASLMILNYDKAGVKEALALPEEMDPVLVMAFGKSMETTVLDEMAPGGSVKYYRDAEGRHHVPKRRLEDVLI